MAENDIGEFINRVTRILDQHRNINVGSIDQIRRLAANQTQLAEDLAHLMSMQNRMTRDLIEIRNRLLAVERTLAYRTQSSDNNDPIVRAQD